MSKDIRSVLQYSDQLFTEIIALINSSSQGCDPNVIASASAISPVWPIFHVSGTATISTINPTAGLSGPIYMIPDGLWSTNTAGNIALGSVAVVNRVLIMVYDNIVGKFYPSY